MKLGSASRTGDPTNVGLKPEENEEDEEDGGMSLHGYQGDHCLHLGL